MTDILQRILAHKKTEVEALDAAELRRAAEQSPAARDFLAAIAPLSVGTSRGRRPKLIAELKRASPSRGMLAPHLDMQTLAQTYISNGASALSVLTDESFFMGSLDTLRELRFERDCKLPLLRKDFIIDAAQVYETRVHGADAILLIAAALKDDARLADLHALAFELGLTPLIEVHGEAELERVLRLKAIRLIGINNRDLSTFEVSLKTTERLRPMIPPEVAVVAESGIFTAADVQRLAKAGADAVLVGEALVTAPDIAAKVRELSGPHVIARRAKPDEAISA
ncbi:MAG TPA: indole-3-glycerol phosphate synthase TrpC [Anaerolineales bacterium]|jgi:indole-3-glycerol phosphate synthase